MSVLADQGPFGLKFLGSFQLNKRFDILSSPSSSPSPSVFFIDGDEVGIYWSTLTREQAGTNNHNEGPAINNSNPIPILVVDNIP